MPVSEEVLEAARKRKADFDAKQSHANEGSPSPQQGANANAGTQLSGVSASASAGNLMSAPAAPAANSPAAAPHVLAVEPTFLLDDDQFNQVLVMKNESLAKAMQIGVEGDTKAIMVRKITRFMGTCKSIKAFDVSNDTYEFEDLKKQDFQQPAAPQSSA